MTLGEKLYQISLARQQENFSQEHLQKEWQDLCTLLERAANNGCTHFILPQNPEKFYPALAANTSWMQAQAIKDRILWSNIQELGEKEPIWSFCWLLSGQNEIESEQYSKERTKLRVGKYHLAYVRTDLLVRFRHINRLVNLTPWLRQVIWKQFHIEINSADDIKRLQEELNQQGYDSCGEWLQELMRNNLKLTN